MWIAFGTTLLRAGIITGPDSEPKVWEGTVLARDRHYNVLIYSRD